MSTFEILLVILAIIVAVCIMYTFVSLLVLRIALIIFKVGKRADSDYRKDN